MRARHHHDVMTMCRNAWPATRKDDFVVARERALLTPLCAECAQRAAA